jgi:hypothetical protein
LAGWKKRVSVKGGEDLETEGEYGDSCMYILFRKKIQVNLEPPSY